MYGRAISIWVELLSLRFLKFLLLKIGYQTILESVGLLGITCYCKSIYLLLLFLR